MSETTESLRRKIDRANDLQSVVRTMKAIAASNIELHERSVQALSDYYRTIELGLSACLWAIGSNPMPEEQNGRQDDLIVGAVVFGSDQGLVGQFNETVADFAIDWLGRIHGQIHVWTVGERVHSRLADAGLTPAGLFGVPISIKAIAPLVGQVLLDSETVLGRSEASSLVLFYNRPAGGGTYHPTKQRLLPLDEAWRRRMASVAWPSRNLPEIVGGGRESLKTLIREYLFVSLFRAGAESLASENASRLAAMQRADKNIGGLLEELNGAFRQRRQSAIDEELFDVISGFEALTGSR